MTSPLMLLPETLEEDTAAVLGALLDRFDQNNPPAHFLKVKAADLAASAEICEADGSFQARLHPALQLLLDQGTVLSVGVCKKQTAYVYFLPPITRVENSRRNYCIEITAQTCLRFQPCDMEAVAAMVGGSLGRHCAIPDSEVRDYIRHGCKQAVHAAEFRRVMALYADVGAVLIDDPERLSIGAWLHEARSAKKARLDLIRAWTDEVLERMVARESDEGVIEDEVQDAPEETVVRVEPLSAAPINGARDFANAALAVYEKACTVTSAETDAAQIAAHLREIERIVAQAGFDLSDVGVFVEDFNLEPESAATPEPERAVRADGRKSAGDVKVAGMTMNAEIIRRRLSSALATNVDLSATFESLVEVATDPDQPVGRALGVDWIRTLMSGSSDADSQRADLKAIRAQLIVDPAIAGSP